MEWAGSGPVQGRAVLVAWKRFRTGTVSRGWAKEGQKLSSIGWRSRLLSLTCVLHGASSVIFFHMTQCSVLATHPNRLACLSSAECSQLVD